MTDSDAEILIPLVCKRAICRSLDVEVTRGPRLEQVAAWTSRPGVPAQREVIDYRCKTCGYDSQHLGRIF
jgi:hypothetical protein